MAAWQNRSDIVELLIANGGKVNQSLISQQFYHTQPLIISLWLFDVVKIASMAIGSVIDQLCTI